jgi:glycosyltransferase involved in cell wall biosynthesis
MISVIVPTYNEEKNIERCLKSLNEQTVPRESYEIIIVDGESKDRTIEIAEKYADKVIQQMSEGVGGARNDGVKIAHGEIIATTDADCIPISEWLEEIQTDFNERDVVAATGVLEPFDFADMSWYHIRIYKILFNLSNILLYLLAKVGYFHLCGANSAFRRDAFLDVDGYIDLAYSDDVEIYKRIRNKGKIVMNKKMKINYSIRRIKKIGLINYMYLITKNDFMTMVLGMKPTKGNYAKQEYN